MTRIGLSLALSGIVLFTIGTTGACAAAEAAGVAAPNLTDPGAPPEAIAHWRSLRFGMFIHWGPVALTGHEIGWSRGRETPIKEYDQLYKRFNPTNFNADEWVATAKAAGMKYMVITTKHHDGFCLWPSDQTDYDIGETPFGRDVLKELSTACRKAGIEFGTYYSVCDWHHPAFPRGSPGGRTAKPTADLDAYDRYLRAQVKELVTRYGPLLVLWFDVPQVYTANYGIPMVRMLRGLQPNIIVNNRAYAAAGRKKGFSHQTEVGDYTTPEQRVGGFDRDRPWETCMTLCRQWAWKPNDALKSLDQCIQILVRTAGGDGNLLLNVGPMPDGRIEPRQVDRLKQIGDWLAQYGESIYGTRGGPFKPGPFGASTCKGHRIYLHVLTWPDGDLRLPPLPRKVTAAGVLGGGKADVEQTETGLVVRVPETDRKDLDTVVTLDLDGPALAIEPVAWSSGSLAAGAKATASNVFAKQVREYGPAKAVDDDLGTRWATDAGTHEAWMQVDLGKPTEIGRVIIDEATRFGGGRIRKFRLEVQKGKAWEPVLEGTTIGRNFEKTFGPITAQRVRLNILKAVEGPTIWEFQLFAK